MNIKRTLTSIAIIGAIALTGNSYAETSDKDKEKQYIEKGKPKIEELYDPILNWIEHKSVPNTVYK